MNRQEIIEAILQSIQVGQEFENPKKGTSKICEKSDERIVYMRGKSKIKINVDDIADAVDLFKGKNCTSMDLREWRPSIFDSKHNGHSCNCTFLFMLWKNADLIEGNIYGGGVKGKPFFVKLKCE